jgi:hypothetical protein
MQTLRKRAEEIRNDVQNYKKNMWYEKLHFLVKFFLYI